MPAMNAPSGAETSSICGLAGAFVPSE